MNCIRRAGETYSQALVRVIPVEIGIRTEITIIVELNQTIRAGWCCCRRCYPGTVPPPESGAGGVDSAIQVGYRQISRYITATQIDGTSEESGPIGPDRSIECGCYRNRTR